MVACRATAEKKKTRIVKDNVPSQGEGKWQAVEARPMQNGIKASLE
jgi:hypothetical protein